MRDLVWVGSSLKVLKAFPAPVQDVMGRALLDAQFGDTPHGAKALKGFRGATVMEIVDDHDRSTFRLHGSVQRYHLRFALLSEEVKIRHRDTEERA